MTFKYVVDICKDSEYTDSNGIIWWGEKYRGCPNVLKLYKDLEGQYSFGITVTKVFKHEGIIKAHIETEDYMPNILNLFLCPKITGELDENKNIISVEYGNTVLDSTPLSNNYAVEGLKGIRLVGEL